MDMNKMIGRVLRPLMLALVVLSAGLAAKADKGFETKVDVGVYRFKLVCHYEPEQYAEVTELSYVPTDELKEISDEERVKLSFPKEVTIYGDTFEVTRAVNMKLNSGARYPSSGFNPRVLDLGNLRVFIDKGYSSSGEYKFYVNYERLEEVIISEFADTIDAAFGNTSIRSIDLKNLKSIGSTFGRTVGYMEINNPTQLRSVKMSPYMTKITDRAFSGCGFLEEIDLSNVVEVGEYAFGSTGLRSVYLPKVEVIDDGAFARSSIESFEINKDARVNISAFMGGKTRSTSGVVGGLGV